MRIVNTPSVNLYAGAGSGVPAHVISIDSQIGNSYGTAVVRYELLYAENGLLSVGNSARLTVGRTTVLRGLVGYSDLVVDDGGDDFNEVTIVDDRFLMTRIVVGQPDIWTVSEESGFEGVGWDLVFNKDGRPNKKLEELAFDTGPDAEFWTLRSILEMVVETWVDSDISLGGDFDDVFNSIPTSVSLMGLNGLQAVDQLFSMAGSDWFLDYGSFGSVIKPAPSGIGHIIDLWAPKGGGTAERSSWADVSSLRVRNRVLDSFDQVSAVSDAVIVETTYTTEGGLLVKADDFVSKEHLLCYQVAVTQYAAAGLGQNLVEGCAPKPWLQKLVTRLNAEGTDYLSAEDVITGQDNPQPEFALWIQFGEEEDIEKRLVVGGFDVDLDNCLIMLRADVDVALAGQKVETISLADKLATLQVEFTVATVTELRRSHTASASGTYLPSHFTRLVEVNALTPQVRVNSKLPDLSGADPAVQVTVGSPAEDYVSVADRLQEAAQAELNASTKAETTGQVVLPFMPVLRVGDGFGVAGRNVGVPSGCWIRSIQFNVDNDYSTVVQFGNVAASKPSNDFMGRREEPRSAAIQDFGHTSIGSTGEHKSKSVDEIRSRGIDEIRSKPGWRRL